jgi:hypothetical protein
MMGNIAVCIPNRGQVQSRGIERGSLKFELRFESPILEAT